FLLENFTSCTDFYLKVVLENSPGLGASRQFNLHDGINIINPILNFKLKLSTKSLTIFLKIFIF
ncbi:MAG: hypothetical protein ACK44H_06130, partial [Candidatus Kryptonium sp.]